MKRERWQFTDCYKMAPVVRDQPYWRKFTHFLVYAYCSPELPEWLYPRSQNIKDKETAEAEAYELKKELNRKYGG